MTWPIRMVEGDRGLAREIGDCYPAPWLVDRDKDEAPEDRQLSAAYYALNGARMPLVIVLPGPVHFCLDARAWKDGQHYGDGWVVTGEAPNFTLSPSINIGGCYHGWIRDGVISDDCEGRTFAPRTTP